MNRRSYIVLTGSLLTAGCTGTGTSDSSTTSDPDATSTGSEETSASTTTNASDSTTPQSEPDGYSGFSGGLIGENVDFSSAHPTIPQGEPVRVKLSVSNEEGTATSYTVAVQLQQYKYTESEGEKSLKVVNRQTVTRSSLTVENGEQESATPKVTINESGKNYRLMFLLYKSDAPNTLSEKTASNSFVVPIDITGSQ